MIKRTVRRRRPTTAVCFFCQEGKNPDYKEPETLARFLTERRKILARDYSGACQKHQRRLAAAIKRARFLALLPFIPST
jgi:small subunit ribosomal protein S18